MRTVSWVFALSVLCRSVLGNLQSRRRKVQTWHADSHAARWSRPQPMSRTWRGILLRGGGLFGKKKKVPATTSKSSAPPLLTNRQAAEKVAAWTLAETALTYSILSWATYSGEPNLELAAAFIIIYGSAALADMLLAVTAFAMSSAAKQVLMPTKVPDQRWYDSLPKPVWTPPNLLFPIMWLLILKPAQVIAVGRLHSGDMTVLARALFCVHLALGDAWNRIFFGERLIGAGVLVIYLFLASLVASALVFAQVDLAAGLFLVPTIAWVNVAAALNLRIYQLKCAQAEADMVAAKSEKRRRAA